jgi:hypothetical protein
LVIVTVLAATGCSDNNNGHALKEDVPSGADLKAQVKGSMDPAPDAILLRYLNEELRAGVEGKSRETYRLLSNKDREAISEEEYLLQSTKGDQHISPELIAAMMQAVSYEVTSSTIEGSVAMLEVEMSLPILSASLSAQLRKTVTPELEQKVIAYLQSPERQVKKNTSSYKLVKEKEGWRVFLDLGTKKKIDTLVADAEELVPSLSMLGPIEGSVLESMKSNLLSAEAKYKDALSLGDDWRAKSNLKYLGEQIQKLRFYEGNKDRVAITNISVGEGLYGGVGVFGEVKNNSDVALSKVGITIYFLDKSGNPVHEKSYHPVYVTEKSHGSDAVPLKPNYSRRFGVKADDAPHEWSKKVKVVLSDLAQ